jgi:hypothetical protein
MAVAPLDIPVTREQVAGWLNIHRQLPKNRQEPLRDFLLARIKAAQLEGVDVDTSGHNSLRHATPLVEMILMDLPSYA